jgi:hypothetical protein
MTEEKIRETLISKLQKLQAKANDPNISEEEAALFAGKVAELLAKHNLSQSELTPEEKEDEAICEDEFVENLHTCAAWSQQLSNYVAQLYFCSVMYVSIRGKQRTKIYFVGKRHNVMVAKSMFIYLSKTITKLANAYAKTQPRPTAARNGFMRGAAERMSGRLWVMWKEATKKDTVSSNPGNLPALYEDEAKIVADFLATKNLRIKKVKPNTDGDHAEHGRRAADDIALNTQIGAGKPATSEDRLNKE